MKPMSYFLMLLTVCGLTVADYFVFTSNHVVSDMADKELQKIFGGTLSYRKIDARVGGEIELEDVELKIAQDGPLFLKCERAEIMLKGKRAERINLYFPELFLTPEVTAKLEEHTAGGTLLPPELQAHLPVVSSVGGRVHFGKKGTLLSNDIPWYEIDDFLMHPLEGEGFYVRGRLREGTKRSERVWRVSGELSLKDRKVDLTMELDQVPFEKLEQLIADELPQIWADYQPHGTAGLKVHLRTKPGRRQPELWMQVDVRSLAFTYRGLPVSNLVGEIRGTLEPDEATGQLSAQFAVDLTTAPGKTVLPGGGQIRVYGRVIDPDKQGPFNIDFELIDADLRDLKAILPAESEKLWNDLKPDGRLAVSGQIARTAAGSQTTRGKAQIRLHGGRANLGPMEGVTELEGNAEFDGTTLYIGKLQGRYGVARVALDGEVRSLDKPEPVAALTVDIRGLSVKRFIEICPPEHNIRNIVSPLDGDDFSNAGDVDVTLRLDPSATPPLNAVDLQLLNNRVTYTAIPLPLHEVSGSVTIYPGRVELHYIKAKYRPAGSDGSALDPKYVDSPVEIRGLSLRDGKVAHASYNVELEKIPMDERFRKKLPPELRDIFEALNLEGHANILCKVDVEGAGPSPDVNFTCEARLFDASIDAGLSLDQIKGTLIIDSVFFSKPGSSVTGTLRFNEARAAGKHILKDISASFNVRKGEVSFGKFTARAYGGMVTGSATVNTNQKTFSGKFVADRVDVREFSTVFRGYNDRGLEGRISIEKLELSGTLGDSKSLTGFGVITVDEASLFGIPVLMRLFDLDITRLFENRPVNLRGKMIFAVRDDKMVISDLKLEDSKLMVFGRGKITFAGEIDLILATNSDFLGVHIPGFSDLLNLVKGELHAWRATGTFNDPSVDSQFLPGTTTPEE